MTYLERRLIEKLKENRLSRYEYVMRGEEKHVARRVMNMNVEGWSGKS
jgi:hypothetical protein